MRVGSKKLDVLVLTVGHPMNGLGQTVDTAVVANLIVDGETFRTLLRWGDTNLSRWTLLVGHTAGIAHKIAA